MKMLGANQKSLLSCGVFIVCLLCLGLAGPGSARQLAHIHPGIPGVCRAIISKVQSYTESNLRSSLVGVRGGICSWLELNGCQQYKVVFTPVYKISFRTVYVNGFVCCAGYSRIGNSCVPNTAATDGPVSRVTPPNGSPDNASPQTGRPPAAPGPDNDNQDGSSSSLWPGFTGMYMTPPRQPKPTTPSLPTGHHQPTIKSNPERTPRTDTDPPTGPRDKLLTILLVLVLVVALCAVASFATHFAKLWRRGRLTCCFGMLSMPRVRNGKDTKDESSKMTCILGTISSDCSTESVRSDLSALSRRSGSDRSGSGQSGLSASSEVTFIDDSDSGIVKHVVYERCSWKDTSSLLSYASSSGTSQGSGSKMSGLLSKKCTPLNTPQLQKKRRPSPPLPVRPERIYDVTPGPHSPPPLPLPPMNHPKRFTPINDPSPGPYSYTSLNKKDLRGLCVNIEQESQRVTPDIAGSPTRVTREAVTLKPPVKPPAYINVKPALDKPRPIYVTLEPDTDNVSFATECREGDEDPWAASSHSLSSSPVSSVGYCALSNQVFPHRRSGNGYDKLERNRQNLTHLPESFPRPEYAVPSVPISSCLVTESDTESQPASRASPDLRRSGTMPSLTLQCMKLFDNTPGWDAQLEEERYIRAPRHNRKEFIFIDAIGKLNAKIKTPSLKHNSVG